MQKVNIKTGELHKLRPISQGTQMDNEAELVDDDPDNVSQPKNILPLPDLEGDEAVKQLLESEGLVVVSESGVTTSNAPITTSNASITIPNITTPSNITTTSNIVVSGGTGLTAFEQNVPASVGKVLTPHNVVTPQYTVVTSSNVEGNEIIIQPTVTGQQITPILPPGVISVPSQPTVINLTESSTSATPVASTIPDEYKRTKYEDTLELKDLKPVSGQKAPKRFFCMKCINKGVETGYTKRNDLVKHLTSCGMEKEKKHKCDYENCTAAYVRPDNLKQHVAQVHTHKFLYFCKKCKQGFFTSPEATNHRKLCFPGKPAPGHTSQETDDNKETSAKKQTIRKILRRKKRVKMMTMNEVYDYCV